MLRCAAAVAERRPDPSRGLSRDIRAQRRFRRNHTGNGKCSHFQNRLEFHVSPSSSSFCSPGGLAFSRCALRRRPELSGHEPISATGGRTEDHPTASPNRQGGGTLSGAPHYQPGGRSGLCPARAVHQASPAAVPVQLGIRGEHGRAPSGPPKKDHFGFVPNRSARP